VRAQAASGRTVLVSSHLLAEVAQSVDDVVVIARGSCGRRARSSGCSGAGARRPPRCGLPTPSAWEPRCGAPATRCSRRSGRTRWWFRHGPGRRRPDRGRRGRRPLRPRAEIALARVRVLRAHGR
jgi:hypothetical protein